jgi:hypothetical protein
MFLGGFLSLGVLLKCLHSLLSSLVDVSRSHNLVVRVLLSEGLQQSVTFLGVGAHQPAHQWDLHTDLLGSLDNTLSNGIALHNTTEDIDENAVDLRVVVQDLEGNFDLLDVGTSSDIKEVSWHTALQLNDIHGGHSQTCTVDHAPDVTVQSNVVESGGDSLLLAGVDIFRSQGCLAQFEQFLLSELSVIVDVDLGVDAVDLVLGVGGPWVDFDLEGVRLHEHSLQVFDLLTPVLDVLQVEFFFDFVEDIVSDSFVDFKGIHLDGVRVSPGDLLNIHTAVLADHESWSLAVPVQHQREVNLSLDVDTLVDEHCIDLEALLRGLVGDQVESQHLLCEILDLLRGVDDLHTALETTA